MNLVIFHKNHASDLLKSPIEFFVAKCYSIHTKQSVSSVSQRYDPASCYFSDVLLLLIH